VEPSKIPFVRCLWRPAPVFSFIVAEVDNAKVFARPVEVRQRLKERINTNSRRFGIICLVFELCCLVPVKSGEF